MGEATPEELVAEYSGKLEVQEKRLRKLINECNSMTQVDDKVWNLIEEYLGDEDARRKEVIVKMKDRIKEQNLVIQQLTDENAYLKEHMAKMADAFERLKKL